VKKLFLLLFFCANVGPLFSQSIDTVFIKETLVNGEFRGNIFSTSLVKIQANQKMLRFKKNKIDSLWYNNKMYSIHKNWLAPGLLERIGSTNAGVYIMNDKVMILKRRDKSYFPISKTNYNKVLSVLSGKKVEGKIDEEAFISALELLESDKESINARLDSAMRIRKATTFRLSFLRPEVGLELSIEPSISLHSAFSVNGFGGVGEPTDAFFNFDQINELRFYFKQEKRIAEGKNSYNYSGFYVAPSFMQAFDAGYAPQYFSGATIGWQDNGLFTNNYSAVKMGGFYSRRDDFYFLLVTYAFGLAF
jgi:hypothetical protein